jgi:hypothetical protein
VCKSIDRLARNALRLPDGSWCMIRTVAMYRRKPNSKGPYTRATDWIAQAGKGPVFWAPTRREAMNKLRVALQPQRESKLKLVQS